MILIIVNGNKFKAHHEIILAATEISSPGVTNFKWIKTYLKNIENG